MLAGFLVPILAVVIPMLPDIFKSKPPQFVLDNPITRPDSAITIVADNEEAKLKQNLNVEFDGVLFSQAGVYIPNSQPHRWQFKVLDKSLPQNKLRDGAHRLRLGFPGDVLSDTLTLLFHTKAPVVQAEVTTPRNRPMDRAISGRVASKLQAPAETLGVDIYFNSEGKKVQIPLPVKRVTDESTGLTYFEFQTTVQSLPQIPPDDPRYSEPFFAFRVRDQAGNQYYHVESYAQFVAPGEKQFGVNSMADIEVSKLPEDLREQTIVSFRFVPKQQPITHLPNGEPAIKLNVTSLTANVRQLEWTHLPDSIRATKPLTVILRDEHQVAISFENKYIDEEAPADKEPTYRVEQTGRDGKVYGSNRAKASPAEKPPQPTPLRKQPLTNLSEEDVTQMIRDKDFFDSERNKSGKGLNNQYEVVIRQETKLVVDRTTNLTWQQDGSENFMNFEQADAYIRKLNTEKYAGFNDWRLPTLEEAMSLMEPKQKHGNLYIDPIFEKTQTWIWTADKESASRAWVVGFYLGYCDYHRVEIINYCVRAVR